MRIDERRLGELIVESQDLQSDAIRGAKEALPMVEAVREERRHNPVEPFKFADFVANRRSVLRKIGIGGGTLLGASGLGATLLGILAPPVAAETIDIQILQTASSLEKLAAGTYAAALTLPFIKDGNKVIVKFAETTMMQHNEHKQAFQAQTKAMGGTVQDTANAKYTPIVEAAKPTLKAPLDVVKLAATLETVARDTYLADLSMFTDKESLTLMATVMGVETQHLATLRAVRALIEGGAPELIAIPTDVAKLPAAAGSVGFDAADYQPTMASPPTEGAIK